MNFGLQRLGGPVYDGSVLLGRRLHQWVTKPGYRDRPVPAPDPDTGDKPTDSPPAEPATERVLDKRAPLKRLGAIGLAGYVIAASDYTTYTVAGGTCAWLVAACMLAGSEPPPAGSEEPEHAEAVPGAVDTTLTDAVRTLAGTGSGAHLKALAEHLYKTTGRPWDPGAVRAACTTAGIPVSNSVRQPGRGVSTGVRLTDLPDLSPPPSPAPPVAVVVAGQGAATETTTATATASTTGVETVVSGVRMTLIDDELNPARTDVTVHH
ncbi:hypothetical protein [Streptomyces sp. NPDC051577]|uniref:hypothetical protein n=1 Tax=Streptomyces sp. NPDC051577 TaxID=3155166 RepID=UPI00343C64B4